MAKHRIKTPTIIQMETAECGATALGIILGYHGKWVNQEELRETCDVSRDGVKASNIIRAAEHYGLQAEGYQLELDELYTLSFPLIVFWNFNHFVVVEGYNNKYVFINDPAVGPRKVSKKEFSESYTGIAIILEPGPTFKKSGQKPKASKLLIHWLRGTKQPFILLAVVTFLLVIPGIAMPAFLKVYIDEVLVLHYNTWLFPLIVGISMSTILSGLMVGLQQYFILRIRTKLGISSASQFFWHILNTPMSFFEQRYVGNVAARINSCENIANILSGPVASSAINVFMIIIFLAVMWLFSAPLTLVVIAVCIVNVLMFLGFQRQLKDSSLNSINQSAKWNSVSLMGVQTIDSLKANGNETDFFARWSGYQASTINSAQKLGVYSSMLSSAPGTFGSITSACVYGLGGYLVIKGQLTIGSLIAFTSLLTQVTSPLNQFIGFAAQFQQISGDIKRVQDAMEASY